MQILFPHNNNEKLSEFILCNENIYFCVVSSIDELL